MLPAATILIVDDDPDVRTALRLALERQGYRVLTAGDGNAGVALAESEGPALVIVDMMMPRQNGLFVLETLKARRGSPAVIMITAHQSGRHRAYAESLGADDFLQKPFPITRLLDSVARLCPLPGPAKPAEPA